MIWLQGLLGMECLHHASTPLAKKVELQFCRANMCVMFKFRQALMVWIPTTWALKVVKVMKYMGALPVMVRARPIHTLGVRPLF